MSASDSGSAASLCSDSESDSDSDTSESLLEGDSKNDGTTTGGSALQPGLCRLTVLFPWYMYDTGTGTR